MKMNKRPAVGLFLIGCAILVFPGLASTNLIPSPRDHARLATEKIGDRWKARVFVAFERETLGNDETEKSESVYFVPATRRLVSVSTVYKNGVMTEKKVTASLFHGLVFVCIVVGSLLCLIQSISSVRSGVRGDT
jgi:hypothetical protein